MTISQLKKEDSSVSGWPKSTKNTTPTMMDLSTGMKLATSSTTSSNSRAGLSPKTTLRSLSTRLTPTGTERFKRGSYMSSTRSWRSTTGTSDLFIKPISPIQIFTSYPSSPPKGIITVLPKLPFLVMVKLNIISNLLHQKQLSPPIDFL